MPDLALGHPCESRLTCIEPRIFHYQKHFLFYNIHAWVITLKWLEGSSLEFQESNDPEGKQTRLQERAWPTMCKMSHGTIQWPQTEATGHTHTHKHAFSMQAQQTHTNTPWKDTMWHSNTHPEHKHTEQGDSKWHGRVIQWPIHCILLFL